jgi:pyruvate dehydrogenase E2 component (dihydrolipoamide acetyltransferase)
VAQQILLPKLGLTMEEGTILEWVVASGDAVRVGDVIMRIATDKVDVDVEAEADGRFEPVATVGVALPPGALVAWLLAEGETAPAAPLAKVEPEAGAAAATVPDATSAPASIDVTDGSAARQKVSPNARRVAKDNGVIISLVRGTGPGGRVVSEDVEDYLASQTAVATDELPAQGARGMVASPLVRRHAEQIGVDVSTVRGTGFGGRIRRADIEQAATAATSQPPAARPAGPRAGQILPLTGMRGAIARNMHASLQEMAQLTHGYEADVSALMATRAQLKAEWAGTGIRVPTINDFVVRATALALIEHPLLNATIRDDGIHLLEQIHVGVAVAVPEGLVVPVVRDADRRGLADIGEETKALADAARTGSLTLPQMEGATFVVSSLGSYGVDFFTPVVNRGNVGIFGVGRVRDGVEWDGETPRRTQVLTLSLSFDHRAVDGAPAAEFLRTVADLLGRPLLLLAG